jgi:hypothetical protein
MTEETQDPTPDPTTTPEPTPDPDTESMTEETQDPTPDPTTTPEPTPDPESESGSGDDEECVDNPEWKDRFGDGCKFYERYFSYEFCDVWDQETDGELKKNCPEACKACPGPEPTPDPTCVDNLTFVDSFGDDCFWYASNGCMDYVNYGQYDACQASCAMCDRKEKGDDSTDPTEIRRRLTSAAFPKLKFPAGVLPPKNDVMNRRRLLSQVSATIFV